MSCQERVCEGSGEVSAPFTLILSRLEVCKMDIQGYPTWISKLSILTGSFVFVLRSIICTD